MTVLLEIVRYIIQTIRMRLIPNTGADKQLYCGGMSYFLRLSDGKS